jgi:hypothetical protein
MLRILSILRRKVSKGGRTYVALRHVPAPVPLTRPWSLGIRRAGMSTQSQAGAPSQSPQAQPPPSSPPPPTDSDNKESKEQDGALGFLIVLFLSLSLSFSRTLALDDGCVNRGRHRLLFALCLCLFRICFHFSLLPLFFLFFFHSRVLWLCVFGEEQTHTFTAKDEDEDIFKQQQPREMAGSGGLNPALFKWAKRLFFILFPSVFVYELFKDGSDGAMLVICLDIFSFLTAVFGVGAVFSCCCTPPRTILHSRFLLPCDAMPPFCLLIQAPRHSWRPI